MRLLRKGCEAYGCLGQTILIDRRKIVGCGVAPGKRLDVGNYACALLSPVRLASRNFSWSTKFGGCGVAQGKRLDVGNYACALLSPVRLASRNFSWSIIL